MEKKQEAHKINSYKVQAAQSYAPMSNGNFSSPAKKLYPTIASVNCVLKSCSPISKILASKKKSLLFMLFILPYSTHLEVLPVAGL